MIEASEADGVCPDVSDGSARSPRPPMGSSSGRTLRMTVERARLKASQASPKTISRAAGAAADTDPTAKAKSTLIMASRRGHFAETMLRDAAKTLMNVADEIREMFAALDKPDDEEAALDQMVLRQIHVLDARIQAMENERQGPPTDATGNLKHKRPRKQGSPTDATYIPKRKRPQK